MYRTKLILFLITLLMMSSCKKSPDYNTIRSEILNLHRAFIQAHLDKDASFIANPTSPEYIFVSGGEIRKITPAELEDNLSDYLDATEFTEYHDIADPIIGISRDGLLAWSIVKVRTAGTRMNSQGSEVDFDIQWAWITLYEKKNDHWIRIVDVSTDRPFITTAD